MRKIILLLMIAVAIAVQRPVQVSSQTPTAVYRVYFPLVIVPLADSRFSVQMGWGSVCCVNLEKTLGLAVGYGGNAHELIPENKLQGINTSDWFNWFNSTSTKTLNNPCRYDKTTERISEETECANWIRSYPDKEWMIGNEPDAPFVAGGNQLSPSEYATMWHVTSNFILTNDHSAKLITAGWAGGICVGGKDNEEDFLTSYRARYGALNADALGLHDYQTSYFDNPRFTDKVDCFSKKTREWKSNGLTKTDIIRLTEFGWYGFDTANNIEANVLSFLMWIAPQLRDNHQLERWHFWQWGEGTRFLNYDGTPTRVGRCYSALARGGVICP